MTTPTIADHKRDAVRYPACNCGAVWKQRGNLTGHCTHCHQTFDGVSLFDRHQHTGDDGRTICTDPATITLGRAKTPLECVNGVWRGPRMDPETIRARFGRTGTGTERRPTPRQTDEQGSKASAFGTDVSEPAHGPTGD